MSLQLLSLLFLNFFFTFAKKKIFFGDLESLSLPHNEIQKIDPYAFSTLLKLSKLNLSFNNLLEISLIPFNSTPNLLELDIGNNKFEKIETGDFKHLIKLKKLYIRGNKYFKTLEENCFSLLKSLELVDITNRYYYPAKQFDRNYLGLADSAIFLPAKSINFASFPWKTKSLN